MDIGEIIAIIIGVPLLIYTLYKIIVIWWIEGNIIESLLSAFGVPQIIILLFSIVGIFVLFLTIFKIASTIV